MGQYYKAVFLEEYEEGQPEKIKDWISPDSSGSGIKLMEFSYIGTRFSNHVMAHIFNKPTRLVIAGDYADEEYGYPEQEDGNPTTLYSLCYDLESLEIAKPKRLPKNFTPTSNTFSNGKSRFCPQYIINHDKGVYVDIYKFEGDDPEAWVVHPLMLLTAEGNGLGGGDYSGLDEDLVGLWARDHISCSHVLPENFAEQTVNFEE